jgi:hypothetical protein
MRTQADTPDGEQAAREKRPSLVVLCWALLQLLGPSQSPRRVPWDLWSLGFLA